MFAIWPESGTLSEVGAAAPQPKAAAQAMGGMGGGMMNSLQAGPGGAGMSGMQSAPNAGEILLNRAESAALAALETEPDEANGLRRAQAESGLTKQQVQKLKTRVDHASSKGYTLKGMGFIKKPTGSAAPDEPGLTRKAVKPGMDEPVPPTKAKAKTKESNATLVRTVTDPEYYGLPVDMDYRLPSPASASEPEMGETAAESNTMTTLAAMLSRTRRKKRQ